MFDVILAEWETDARSASAGAARSSIHLAKISPGCAVSGHWRCVVCHELEKGATSLVEALFPSLNHPLLLWYTSLNHFGMVARSKV